MSTIIGLKELREHTPEVAERVSKGESFIVFKRSTPLFKLSPIEEPIGRDGELRDWTTEAINRWRPALKALAEE